METSPRPHPNRSKDELVGELERQRTRLTRRGAEVEAAADIGRHWRDSVARHPIAWVGAGAMTGFALARVLVASASHSNSRGGQKSASHRRKSVLPTMPVAVSFLAQAAFKALRPQLEKAVRARVDRAASRLAARPDEAPAEPAGPDPAP